jgi:hypothetical protein
MDALLKRCVVCDSVKTKGSYDSKVSTICKACTAKISSEEKPPDFNTVFTTQLEQVKCQVNTLELIVRLLKHEPNLSIDLVKNIEDISEHIESILTDMEKTANEFILTRETKP